MFGYVKCYKDEMKVKHTRLYDAYYCGICSRIQHQWGMLFRISLSYDVTFLSIFLDNYSMKSETYQFHCPFMPFRKRKLRCDISMLDYAAVINGYLFIKKLEDNFQDDNNWLCGLLAFYLKKRRRYHRFQTDHEELFLKLEDYYLRYMEAEKGQIYCSIDEYSGLFGDFLGQVYQGITEYNHENLKEEKMKQSLFVFGKIFGMWIYVIDALDDYAIDKKRGKFNPLMYIGEDENILLDKVQKMLMLMQKDLLIKFKEMGQNINGEFIENILTYGMRNSMCKVAESWRKEKFENGFSE